MNALDCLLSQQRMLLMQGLKRSFVLTLSSPAIESQGAALPQFRQSALVELCHDLSAFGSQPPELAE